MFGWLKEFFVGIGAKVKAFFKTPGGLIIRDALASAIQVAGVIGTSVLLEEAKKRVKNLDDQTLPNAVKAIDARDYLIGYAGRVGVNVSTSLINMLVEIAVQALRSEQKE